MTFAGTVNHFEDTTAPAQSFPFHSIPDADYQSAFDQYLLGSSGAPLRALVSCVSVCSTRVIILSCASGLTNADT
jgi:hypothetical protein